MSSLIAGYASFLTEYNFLHKNGSILSSRKGLKRKVQLSLKRHRYQPSRRPRLITFCQDLDYLGYHKNRLITVSLYIVLKKIMTKTPSQGTGIAIVSGNHALRA